MKIFRNIDIIILVILIIGWSLLSIIPISIDQTSTISKIIFTILSWVPLFITGYNFWYNYIRVSFNSTKKDDNSIKLIPLIITFFLFVISWANIFLLFWLYDGVNSWSDFDPNRGAYEMWVRFVYSSLLMSVGVGFASHVPQTTFCGIISGLMAWICVVITSTVAISASLELILENINNSNADKNFKKKYDINDINDNNDVSNEFKFSQTNRSYLVN